MLLLFWRYFLFETVTNFTISTLLTWPCGYSLGVVRQLRFSSTTSFRLLRSLAAREGGEFQETVRRKHFVLLLLVSDNVCMMWIYTNLRYLRYNENVEQLEYTPDSPHTYWRVRLQGDLMDWFLPIYPDRSWHRSHFHSFRSVVN